jgi:uncharacterized protein YjbI with pentapeptide repeats
MVDQQTNGNGSAETVQNLPPRVGLETHTYFIPEPASDEQSVRRKRGTEEQERIIADLEVAAKEEHGKRTHRNGRELEGYDWEGFDFRGCDLRGVVAAEKKLTGADFRGARLDGADFRGAQLTGADLRRAQLDGADFRGARLDGADFRGARLDGAHFRGAQLNGADFREAQIKRADFRATKLIRADLAGSVVTGTLFRDADLRGARIADAIELSAERLGGADLRGTEPPDGIKKFAGLEAVKNVSTYLQGLFKIILGVCAVGVLTVLSLRDDQVLEHRGGKPIPVPGLHTVTSPSTFAAVVPLIIFVLQGYFAVYVHFLWRELALLPAYFPDGTPLDRRAYPTLFNTFVRLHFERLPERATDWIQAIASTFLAFGIAPVSLFCFWIGYLRRHDARLSGFQGLLFALSVGLAALLLLIAQVVLRDERSEWLPLRVRKDRRRARISDKASAIPHTRICLELVVLVVAILALLMTSAEPIFASKNLKIPVSDSCDLDVQEHITAKISEYLGIGLFLDIAGKELSSRPAELTGRPDADVAILAAVVGADLEGADLRSADANNAVLVNANLSGAKLDHANLENADLRGANLCRTVLRHSVLRGAKLSNANFAEANLTGADLRGVDLMQADFSNADLSRADLRRAKISNAIFTGANLTGADLRSVDRSRVRTLTEAQLDSAWIVRN